jgi:hypothetical protein
MTGYFNVFTDIKIGGKLHVPCVSYAVTPNNEATIEKLVKEGKAENTEKMSVFQSGKKLLSGKKEKAKRSSIEAKASIKEKVETKEKKEEKEEKKEEKPEF